MIHCRLFDREVLGSNRVVYRLLMRRTGENLHEAQ
jgi:hypothetical protein